MFVAMDAKQHTLVTLVAHEQADRLRQTPFVCPACLQPVRVKNGVVMPAHFAHIGPACAAASEGESADHLTGKRWLADLGVKLGYQVSLEVYYPAIRQRADVVWERAGRTLVIEFQCSPLSPQRLATRTRGYRRLQVTCIWVMGPRYYTRRPGKMQARFMQAGATGDYWLWFSDGRQYLERWLWQEEGYLVTRYTGGAPTQRLVGMQRSANRAARLIASQLQHRDKAVLTLQALAYQHGQHVAGVPWLVHKGLTNLPGLRWPEWQLRTRWLLTFAGADISRAIEADWWHQQEVAALTPLVNTQRLMITVAQAWRRQLLAAGYLVQTVSGWRWTRPLTWYPDLTHKLAAAD